MNKPMLSAAILMLVTFLVHTFVGGPEIQTPIFESTLAADVKAISIVVWHMITVTLAGFTLALFYLAKNRNPALAGILSALMLAYAALFLGYGLARFGDVTTMPQWTFFVLTPLLVIWGSRKY